MKKILSLFGLILILLICSCCHKHEYIDGVCECGSFSKEWLKVNFDINEKKSYFNGNAEQDFTDDLIIVTLKKSTTYPILNERHFKLDEPITIEYTFIEPKSSEVAPNFHQILFIHLEPSSKEHIIELINQIEQLPFVLAAEPNFVMHLE